MPAKDILNNQTFVDAARSRGDNCLFCSESKSGECLIVSGSPESIRLLTELLDDYECVCEILESIASTALDRMGGIPE